MEIHVVAGSCQNTDRCQRNDGDRQAQSDVKEVASIEKRIEERLPGRQPHAGEEKCLSPLSKHEIGGMSRVSD